jgi:hypothetical protein
MSIVRCERLRLQTPLHVSVCGFDQLRQSRSIDTMCGPQFHVAHELAGAFQQTIRIGNLGAQSRMTSNQRRAIAPNSPACSRIQTSIAGSLRTELEHRKSRLMDFSSTTRPP